MEHIEVEIGPGGEVSIDAVGFSGADCEQATRFLEKALGKTAGRKRKPEYWRQRRRNAAHTAAGLNNGRR